MKVQVDSEHSAVGVCSLNFKGPLRTTQVALPAAGGPAGGPGLPVGEGPGYHDASDGPVIPGPRPGARRLRVTGSPSPSRPPAPGGESSGPVRGCSESGDSGSDSDHDPGHRRRGPRDASAPGPAGGRRASALRLADELKLPWQRPFERGTVARRRGTRRSPST